MCGLMGALIVLDFAGIFCFGSSLLVNCKIQEGVHVHA